MRFFGGIIKVGQFYVVEIYSGVDCERIANTIVVNNNLEVTDSLSAMVDGCPPMLGEDKFVEPEKDTLGNFLIYLDGYTNQMEETRVNLTEYGCIYSDTTDYELEDMDTKQKYFYQDTDVREYKVDKNGHFVKSHYERGLSLGSIMKYKERKKTQDTYIITHSKASNLWKLQYFDSVIVDKREAFRQQWRKAFFVME